MSVRSPTGVLVAVGLLVLAGGAAFFLTLSGDDQTPKPVPAQGEPVVDSPVSDPVPEPEEFYEEEEAGPRLALVGTVVASHRKWSTATIVDLETNESGQYRIGEQLPTDARLVAIRSDRVYIKRHGNREVLLLSEGMRQTRKRARAEVEDSQELDDSPRGAVSDQAEPYSIPEDMVRVTGKGEYTVSRDSMDRLLASPGGLVRSALFTLAFDDGGRMEGLRLAIGPTGTLFRMAGLKSGDVILRVGPVTVDSPESLSAVIEQLGQAVILDLELDRGGRRVTLRYKFD